MTGARPGIGIVVPADFVLDDEYWRLVGEDAVLHLTRIPVLPAQVDRAAARAVGDPVLVAQGVRLLAPARPEATVYACTAGSFIDGAAGETLLVDAMRDAGARRPLTTSGAIVRALGALSIERVGVATPYTSDLTDALVAYLQECGISVVGRSSLELREGIAEVPAARVLEAIREADRPDADAVVLSCTNLRTVGAHESWESAVGKPVIGANQATVWAALRAVGAGTRTVVGHLGKETRT